MLEALMYPKAAVNVLYIKVSWFFLYKFLRNCEGLVLVWGFFHACLRKILIQLLELDLAANEW